MLRTPFLALTLVSFLFSSIFSPLPQARADEYRLPAPGVMVNLSPAYKPAHLVGMTIHQDNALNFDFLIDQGDENLSSSEKNQEYKRLVKYFLASLTIPDNDQWVNLSPYEHHRIIPDNFGKTEMGRDLLGQDYLLKQITSSLICPEKSLGKKFWDKVYTLAWKQYGTTNIAINTFNKVWIIPDQAAVYESGNTVYVLRNHLKVMLEEDYLSLHKHASIANQASNNQTHSIASKVVREIVLPQLELEINEGKNFSQLRQIYSGMILAAWYKEALRGSLLEKIYANKSRLKGINQDPRRNEEIFRQYLEAFKKGVFNYIKEDTDRYTQERVPRKYFSGGMLDFATVTRDLTRGFQPRSLLVFGPDVLVPPKLSSEIDFSAASSSRIDRAMVSLDEAKGGNNSLPQATRLKRDPNKERLDFEFEFQIKDQDIGIDRNGNLSASEWFHKAGEIVKTINSILPFNWTRNTNFDPDSKVVTNFNEFTTAENGANNTDETWKEITEVLNMVQEGPLKGGVTSIHANFSDDRIPDMVVDKRRFGRVVKTYEAMWRALGGRGYSRASSKTITVLSLANEDQEDLGGDVYSHDSIINLGSLNRIEVKIFEGDVVPVSGKQGRLVDPVKLRERTDWGFNLLHFVADSHDAGPLAVLGIPVLAGHKPTQKQIDRFIKLFFSEDTQERQEYVRGVFRSLENEAPGASARERQRDDQNVEEYFTKLGLRRVYDRHKENEGYDENIVDYFLNNPDALKGLAQDLLRAHRSDRVSLSYFPQEMRTPLEAELVSLRADDFQFRIRDYFLKKIKLSGLNEIIIRPTLQEIDYSRILNTEIINNAPLTFEAEELLPLNNDMNSIERQDIQFRVIMEGISLNEQIGHDQESINKLSEIVQDSLMASSQPGNLFIRIFNRNFFHNLRDFFQRHRNNDLEQVLSSVNPEEDSKTDQDKAQVGGIDFNSVNLNLQIKRDGRGIALPFNQQDMVQLNRIQGFVPDIIEIKPVSGLPILSELKEKLRTQTTLLASTAN